MKKTIYVVIICVCLVLASCSNQQEDTTVPAEEDIETLTITVAHEAAPYHSLNLNLLHMGQWLDEQSEGRIELRVFPNYIMGDTKESLALVAEGTIEMVIVPTADLAALADQVDEDYPFSVPDSWEAWDQLDGFYPFTDTPTPRLP